MSGKALVCKLTNIKPIEGADKIVQADLFGETIITSVDNVEGTTGLLFDCDTQLSLEYAKQNNMFRHSQLNSDNSINGYMEDDRRVRPIKLRGVKCTGLFMPIDTLEFIGCDTTHLKVGEEISEINGVMICEKYITQETKQRIPNVNPLSPRLVPTFKEHFDTDQYQRCKDLIAKDDLVIITEKLHGTSGRCGYLSVDCSDKYTWFQKKVHELCDWLFDSYSSYTEYQFVIGSRRVVKKIGDEVRKGDSFYDHDIWTDSAEKFFKDRLHEGETVYYEIVGNMPNGAPIMSGHGSSKLKSFLAKDEYEDFVRQYGEVASFHYGNKPNEYDIYVYRITMTNDEGVSYDLSWDQVKTRCAKLNVKHVPEIYRFLSNGDSTYEGLVTACLNMRSDTFRDTPKEGICIRIDNGGAQPKILKEKSYIFKVLENIIKELPVVDVEEAN